MSKITLINNLPNILSVLRILLGLNIFFVSLYCKYYHAYTDIGILITLISFIIAIITDFFDGFLARKLHNITAGGAIIDQLADKILIYCTINGIYNLGYNSFIYNLSSSIIVIRDISALGIREYQARQTSQSILSPNHIISHKQFHAHKAHAKTNTKLVPNISNKTNSNMQFAVSKIAKCKTAIVFIALFNILLGLYIQNCHHEAQCKSVMSCLLQNIDWIVSSGPILLLLGALLAIGTMIQYLYRLSGYYNKKSQ